MRRFTTAKIVVADPGCGTKLEIKIGVARSHYLLLIQLGTTALISTLSLHTLYTLP